MNDLGYVLDASAILALLNQEQGADKVEQAILLPQTCISSVQIAEVTAKLVLMGMPQAAIREIWTELALNSIAVTDEVALESAWLAEFTKPLGLSLGDRLCLATSKIIGLPALTADKIWSKIPSCQVELIR